MESFGMHSLNWMFVILRLLGCDDIFASHGWWSKCGKT